MRANHRTPTALSLVAALAVLGAGLAPMPAAAKDCDSDWNEPVVCSIELVYSVRGEDRRHRVRGNETVRLRTDVHTILSVRPKDQDDQAFPVRRFAYELAVGNDCRGLVDIVEERTGELRLETGRRTGTCELAILPANNLNLDQRLTLQVVETTPGTVIDGGPEVSERSEILATWLYRAILGRDGEETGIADAAARIDRGDLGEQVDLMLRSPEFQDRRRGMTAAQLLDSFYQGLLGRGPDPAGTRRYMDDMLQANFDDVLDEMLASRELQERLSRAAAQ